MLTPPALWIQGQPDIVHDYHDPDYAGSEHEPQRFVNNYRKAGGEIDLLYVDNAKKAGAGSFATGGSIPASAYPGLTTCHCEEQSDAAIAVTLGADKLTEIASSLRSSQ